MEEPYGDCVLTVEELATKYPQSGIAHANVRSSRGLSTAAAAEILARVGPNSLSERKQTPAWVKFLLLFTGGFQLFLQTCGVLCFVAYGIDPAKDPSNPALGAVLFAVVVLTNAFQFMQDSKTGAMMAQFKKEGQGSNLTLRDGAQGRIDSSQLVPGDLVILKEGDKITADFRLIEVQGFKVDQSALTGESVQVSKTADRTDDPTFRSTNLALSGTLIATGQAVGLVVQTGDRTYNGHMAHLVVDTVKRESLLKRNIRRAVHVISGCGVVAAVVILIAAVVQRFSPVAVILLVIGAVLGNLPEGLLPTLTLCLALAAKRMRDVNVLVKNMESVETLGACSAICTDKTGTLTQNVMTVVKVWFNGTVEDTDVFADPALYRSRAALGQIATEHQRNPRYNADLRRTESSLRSSGSRIMNILSSGSRIGLGLTRQDRKESRPLVQEGITGTGLEVVIDDPANAALRRRTSSRSFRSLAEYGGAGPAPSAVHPTPRTESVREMMMFDQFLHCSALCSSAEWDNKPGLDPVTQQPVPFAELPIARRGVQGDASETAIMRFAEQALGAGFNTTVAQQRAARRKLGAIPFNSRNKWMLVVVESPEDRCNVLYLKGGFDRVWGMCGKILWNDAIVPIADAHRAAYRRDSRALSRQGMRLLALAFAPLDPAAYPYGHELWNQEEDLWKAGRLPVPPPDARGPHPDLVFVGLVAIQDPPKDGVLTAVNECHGASIKVVMVTGDHPDTAKAIAQQLNILQGKTVADLLEAKGIEEPTWDQICNPGALLTEAERAQAMGIVVTGEQLATFDEDMWQRTLRHEYIVFARTSPEQKLLIVQHFQDLFGAVVAATGDGVNDSPALRQANVGICMGISGADVTRETADIVLMDDNFASIVNGIAEGRLMYENLKKSVAYTLIHMVAEITPFLLNAFIEFPLALTTVQLLCIDLGTEMVTAVSFGHEPAEALIMQVPPRNPAAPLITPNLLLYAYGQMGLLETLASFLVFLWVFAHEGYAASVLPHSATGYWDGETPVTSAFSAAHDLAALRRAQSAYFLSVVLCQAACALNTRTARSFLWDHGLLSNPKLLFGIGFGVLLAAFIIYTPGVDDIFKYGRLQPLYWAYCLPGPAVLLLFDLARKALFQAAPRSCATRVLVF